VSTLARPISVLVVDDHPMVVEVLNAIVRAVFPGALLGMATGLDEALAAARTAPEPDLVLLDLGLPGCSGISALVRLREAAPALRVVVVSAVESRRVVLAALAAGAAGYIPKTLQPPLVAAALRLVAAGGTYVPLECIEPETQIEPERPQVALTARQRDVLRLIVKGFANKEIAAPAHRAGHGEAACARGVRRARRGGPRASRARRREPRHQARLTVAQSSTLGLTHQGYRDEHAA